MTKKTRDTEFRNILITTDFSDLSGETFTYALSVAKKYGAKLHILHVVDTAAHAAGFYLPHLSFDKIGEDMTKAAEKMLSKHYIKELHGFDDYDSTVLTGAPHEEIIKYASTHEVDLVVMGCFGRTGLDRIVFGSTTERVMRALNCPVLAVSPE